MELSALIIFFQVAYFLYFMLLNSYYLFLNLMAATVLLKRSQEKVIAGMPRTYSGFELPISIIVPAFNEEKTIEASIKALLQLNYPEYEIIVVNDGSTDETLQVLIDKFSLAPYPEAYRVSIPVQPIHGFYRSTIYPNLRVIDKKNGGKADALNAGINTSRYPLFCCIDADSILTRDNIIYVALQFLEDPKTIACGGTIRIANGCEFSDGNLIKVGLSKNVLALIQTMEYLRAFLFGRLGWVPLNSLLIISGSFSVFRKKEVIDVGGYNVKTVSEDMELVVRLHRYFRTKKIPYRITSIPEPICYTEVPEDLRSLKNQRVRWQKGLSESLSYNIDLLFHPRGGAVGWLSFPLNLVFEWFGPIFEFSGYIFFILGIILGIISVEALIAFLILAIGFSLFISITTLVLEEMSFRIYPKPKNLLLLFLAALLENLGFRQINTYWRLLGLLSWIFIKERLWGQIERKGTQTV